MLLFLRKDFMQEFGYYGILYQLSVFFFLSRRLLKEEYQAV